MGQDHGYGVITPLNNSSVISWRSVLLVEETRVPGKTTDLPQVTDKLITMLYESTSLGWDSNSQRNKRM